MIPLHLKKQYPLFLSLSIFFQLSCVTSHSSPSNRSPITLVESPIIETKLDQESVPDTADVWLSLINNAKTSIDFAQQYAYILDAPSEMQQILDALKAAGERGVKIRFLLGNHLQKRNGDGIIASIDLLRKLPNTEVRETSRWDQDKGILHTKYMIVDGQKSFAGSANFDWKALNHIKEAGFLIDSHEASQRLSKLFEDDWQNFASSDAPQSLPDDFSEKISWQEDGQSAWMQFKLSPNIRKLPEKHWDLPELLAMLNQAKSEIKLTSMVYKTKTYATNSGFYDVEKALIDAAKRGVRVQVMFDDRNHDFPLIALSDGAVQIKRVKIPEHSSGPIPFARLIHAKYAVVDGHRIWTGSSNFSGDYFYYSRNLSIFVDSYQIGEQFARMFDSYWHSEYAYDWQKPENRQKKANPIGH